MLKNGIYGGLFAALAAFSCLADVALPDTAWRDGEIVFDDADAGTSYRMVEARTAKGVDFGAAVSLSGEMLTLTANSSIVVGEGVLEFSDSSAMVWTPGVLLSLTGDVRKLERGTCDSVGTSRLRSRRGFPKTSWRLCATTVTSGFKSTTMAGCGPRRQARCSSSANLDLITSARKTGKPPEYDGDA